MEGSKQGRNILFDIYQAAIAAVHGKTVIDHYLTENFIKGKVYVIAIGKAASAMAEGAVNQLGNNDRCCLTGGLIITKEGHAARNPLYINASPESEFESVTGSGLDYDTSSQPNTSVNSNSGLLVIESAHPIPDQRSLDAGKSLVETLQGLPGDVHLLLLISGGASSLVELLPDSVSLQELQHLNQWLLASGLAIKDVNKLRRQVSLLKQGGLLNYINAEQLTALYISDVEGNNHRVIASGLVSEIPKGKLDLETARIINGRLQQISHEKLREQTDSKNSQGADHIPDTIVEILRKGQDVRYQDVRYQENTESTNATPSTCSVKHKVVASLAHALLAASESVVKKGLVLNYIPDLYDDLQLAAKQIAARLIKMSPGVLIAGGEVTVQLPKNPGQGGRNQSLALAVAIEITNQHNIVFMAIGTDGSDGPGSDAGAIVDGETCERGMIQGLEPLDHLKRADAGVFLEATGDLISTGPTGTNVMDLYIGVKI